MPADKFMRDNFILGKEFIHFLQLIFGLFQKGGIFGSIGKGMLTQKLR